MAEHKLSEKEIVSRVELALGDLTSGGGRIVEEKADKFIQIVQDSTPVMRAVRVEKMNSHTKILPRIAFPGQILIGSPGDNVVFPDVSNVAPTFDDVSIETVEVLGRTSIPDAVIEDNPEKEMLETTILAGMATRVGLDLENMGLNGDTASANPLLALQNGWLKRITSHVVNAGGADISQALWDQAFESVPLKYRQLTAGSFVWFVHDHTANKWRQIIASRGTNLGDQTVLSAATPPANGYPVVPVANIVAAGSPSRTVALFTNPKNLIVGFWRDIKVEPFRRPEKRRWEFYISARVGFEVEQQEGAAKITGLLPA